ncbi:hypothetical protein N431DRAFT_329627 [Stipitochalara longipes BDJ]|nr:hypothetical protein N431DRAFT_329627 [Stipitochalara longipes BDJ]
MPPKGVTSDDTPSPKPSKSDSTPRGHGKHLSNGEVIVDKQLDKVAETLSSINDKIDQLTYELKSQKEEPDIKSQLGNLTEALDSLSSKVDDLSKDVDEKLASGMDDEQFDEIKQALQKISDKPDAPAGTLNEEQSRKIDERLQQLQDAANHLVAQARSQTDGAPLTGHPKEPAKPEKSDESENRNDFIVRINLWCKEGEKLVKGGHDLFTIDSTLNLPDLKADLAGQFKVLFEQNIEGRSNFSDGVVYWTKSHKIVSVKADWAPATVGEAWTDETARPTGTTLTTSNCKQFLKLLKSQSVPTMAVIIAFIEKKKKDDDDDE